MGIVTGRKALVSVSSCTIEYIGKWTINVAADTVEAVYFGSYWGATFPVGQKWNGTIEGFFDATSTGVQNAAWAAMLNNTKQQDVKFLVGGNTSGYFWMPACSTDCTILSTDAGAYLGNFRQSVGAKEINTITCDVQGYKGLVMCLATSTTIVLQSTA